MWFKRILRLGLAGLSKTTIDVGFFQYRITTGLYRIASLAGIMLECAGTQYRQDRDRERTLTKVMFPKSWQSAACQK